MENPDIETSHHRHTGRPLLDLVLGISAIAISLTSLFLAIQNDKAMEHLVQANSWPLVQVTYSTSNADASPHAHLDIANKGVGPASIESLDVTFQGRHLRDKKDLVDALLKRTTVTEHPHVLSSDVVHSVLSAKETVTFIDFIPLQEYSPQDYAAITQGIQELQLQACYCSVFDECWIFDNKTPRPTQVKTCPVSTASF